MRNKKKKNREKITFQETEDKERAISAHPFLKGTKAARAARRKTDRSIIIQGEEKAL